MKNLTADSCCDVMSVCSPLQAENIMFLELDMCPPNPSSLDCLAEAATNQTPSQENSPTKNRDIHKSSSWWARMWTFTALTWLLTHLEALDWNFFKWIYEWKENLLAKLQNRHTYVNIFVIFLSWSGFYFKTI